MENCIISFYNKCDIMFNHLNHGNHCGSFRIASCLLEHRLYRIFLRAVKRTRKELPYMYHMPVTSHVNNAKSATFYNDDLNSKGETLLTFLWEKTKVMKIAF